MIRIRRFDSFEEAKKTCTDLNSFIVWPFQSFWWQEIFARRFCQPENIYLLGVYENSELIAYTAFERSGNKILWLGMKRILGGYKVTDFGDLILKLNIKNKKANISDAHKISVLWQAIIAYFIKEGIKEIQLDNVREDSLTLKSIKSVKSIKWIKSIKMTPQQIAPEMVLPASWDDYLHGLERVKRKELKRKIKRLETQQSFKFCSDKTIQDDFAEFVRLHRLSDPEKNQFMNDEMKEFFWDLINTKKGEWETRLCFLKINGQKAAAAFTFRNQIHTLLYASGFDPSFGYFSAGLLLNAYLIKMAIEEGKKVFSFLVGNERYKYDLGGKDRQLYQITAKL